MCIAQNNNLDYIAMYYVAYFYTCIILGISAESSLKLFPYVSFPSWGVITDQQ